MYETQTMMKQILLSLILITISYFHVIAQVDNSSDLFIELRKQDSMLFERGFNNCDIDYLEDHITQDLKFYHDQSGIQDRKDFFENIQKYICSNSEVKPIRKVDTSSLEVFPLHNNGIMYGAIQKGIHHFYLRENDKEDLWTSTAKFTTVWNLTEETWKISTVLSYDHQDPKLDTINNSIENVLQENNIPALGLGIIENGALTKVELYGTLDKHETAPYNTIFKVASLTKPIVAIITFKLIDQGLLDLDEPLYKYWIDPDIKNDKRYEKLTPKLVLSHQTGFPNWRHLNDSNILEFQYDPGTIYQYSGEGFEYLRKAIELKLDKSIEELAQELLFTPLDMSDTRFWWDSNMDEDRYAQNFDEKGMQLETVKYYEANAAANLLTTVEDYGKFLVHVINGAELNTPLYQEMIRPHVELKENDFFGLGWEILTEFTNDEIALLHTGKDPGVSTLAIWFPKSKNGYLIFLNGDNAMNVYEELLTSRLYLGQDLWNKR